MLNMSAVRRYADRMSMPATVAASCVLASFFGICLTIHLLFMPGRPYLLQTVAAAVKVPCVVAGGCAAATAVLWVLARGWSPGLRVRDTVRSAAGCMLTTSVGMALLGPVMVAISSFGNYTALLFSAYASFAVSGLAGCRTFQRRLAGAGRQSRAARVLNPAVWTVLFALAAGEIGWNARPIVGWTGVPFTWFRHDGGGMWHQIRCEGQNLRRGGAPLPTMPDEFRGEDFPC